MNERETIERALREAKGNIGRAAHSLGVARRTLQNRMREYGMARGKAGRPKRRIVGGRKAKGWATAGAVAAVVGGVLLIKRGSKA